MVAPDIDVATVAVPGDCCGVAVTLAGGGNMARLAPTPAGAGTSGTVAGAASPNAFDSGPKSSSISWREVGRSSGFARKHLATIALMSAGTGNLPLAASLAEHSSRHFGIMFCSTHTRKFSDQHPTSRRNQSPTFCFKYCTSATEVTSSYGTDFVTISSSVIPKQ
jgi:hypothetical protein